MTEFLSKSTFCVPFGSKVTKNSRKRGFSERNQRKNISTKIDAKVFSQESNPLSSQKKENKRGKYKSTRCSPLLEKTKQDVLHNVVVQKARHTKKARSVEKSGLITHRVANERFSKPKLAQRKTRGHALRRALSEVKPCIDLRQVRRGRKTFQIPRIIPSMKRQLFGVRRLLSILSVAPKKNVETSVRGKDSVFQKRRGVADGNRGNVPVSRKTLVNESPVNALSNAVLHNPGFTATGTSLVDLPNLKMDYKSHNHVVRASGIEKQRALWSTTNSYASARSRTRTTQDKESKLSSLSLSHVLGNEVKASSRSRSRAVENKKRIYRVASANRGSIRMSWWL